MRTAARVLSATVAMMLIVQAMPWLAAPTGLAVEEKALVSQATTAAAQYVEGKRESVSAAADASVFWQAPSTESGLKLVNLGDDQTKTTPVTIGERSAIQLSALGLAWFDVSDAFIYQGKDGSGQTVTDVAVEVSYYDRGYGWFYVQYDSTGPLGASASDAEHWASFGAFGDTIYQFDNLVYLTNSERWLTYTFHLANVYFGERLLRGVADLRVNYYLPNQEPANMGYMLAIDRVTVTSSASPRDLRDRLSGNYPGFGAPIAVWTLLGSINEQGHGLRQVDSADGPTVAELKGGRQSRRATGKYMYFDVNDEYVKGCSAFHVYAAVQYWDAPATSFSIDYDAGAANRYRASAAVQRTGASAWMTRTILLEEPCFGNGQAAGAADFRLVAPGSDLNVAGVFVMRAPGDYVLPRGQQTTGQNPGYSSRQRMVTIQYYPAFDGHYPSHWERSTMGPPGADPTTHIARDYSWRSVATLKKDLEDMKAANIDVAVVWHQGAATESSFSSVQAMNNLVAAARQVSSPPKLALLLDPVVIFDEPWTKPYKGSLDLTSPTDQALLFKIAEDFFSLVPPDLRAMVDGRPLVYLYFQFPPYVTAYDSRLVEFINAHFQRSFGVRPYLVVDQLWDPLTDGQRRKGLQADDWFVVGAAIGAGDAVVPLGATSIAVGAGYDNGSLKKDRENGQFYVRSWRRAAGKGPHVVVLDTWNYWVEGGPIAESAEYGRTYIDLTTEFAGQFKSTSYAASTRASVRLRSQNQLQGVYQDETGDGATEVVTVGGAEGRRAKGSYIYLSVDDTFLYDVPTGSQVTVTVTYWGQGPLFFDLKYDGAGQVWSWGGDPAGRAILGQPQEQTEQWKTKSFVLTDAKFLNRQNDGNDLRLDLSATGLVVREVTVEKPASLAAAPQVSPAGLTFEAPSSGGEPMTQNLTLSLGGSGGAANWTASGYPAWVTLSATSGSSLPATVGVTVDPSKTTAVVNRGEILFTISGTQIKVPVILVMGDRLNRTFLPLATKSYSGGW